MFRKISRKGLDEKIILFALFLQIFIMQWLGLSSKFSYIITCIIFIYVIKCVFTKKTKPGIWAVLFIFFLYLLIQPIRDDFKIDAFNFNLKLMSGMISVVCFFYFVGNKFSNLELMLKKSFLIINAYIVINIPVIFAQINGHYELSGRHSSDDNLFIPDLISGLFGYNGTPMLAVFLCFFFLYDYWYFKKYMKKSNKKIFIIYYIAVFLFFMYLPIINDNKGFYIEFFIVCILYLLSVQKINKKIIFILKKYNKIIIGVAALIISFFAAYKYFDSFKDLVDLAISVINKGINSTSRGGSATRLSTVNLFLQSDVNKLIGYGMGFCRWREPDAFGFKLFGQSDLGPFLLMGGFVFVFLLLFLLYITLCRMNRSRLLSVGEIIFFVFLLLYTQPATNCSIFASTMLIFLLLGIINHEKSK